MWVDTSVLYIDHLPEVRIDSGTDWITLFGFLLTAIAVIAGSMVTVWTFRKTVRSQEELARKVSVKQSRQDWINELRNSCSSYVAEILVLKGHQMIHDAHSNVSLKLLEHDPAAAANMQAEWGRERSALRSSAYALRAKIILLSNPREQLFKDLLREVDDAMDKAESDGESVRDQCDRIINLAQQILKIEWDRARKMID
jgi:hypothetical protein